MSSFVFAIVAKCHKQIFNSYLSQSPLMSQRKALYFLVAGHYGDNFSVRHAILPDFKSLRNQAGKKNQNLYVLSDL
jgi:hypothetical protein